MTEGVCFSAQVGEIPILGKDARSGSGMECFVARKICSLMRGSSIWISSFATAPTVVEVLAFP